MEQPHLPPGTVADLAEGGTLPGRWRQVWARDPGAGVLHAGGRWTTAAELEERTRGVAQRLTGAGLVAGERLLLSGAPTLDLVVAHVAALRLGLVVVPVNPSHGEREVGHVVRDCRPAAALVDDATRGEWVRTAGDPRLVTSVDVPLPDGPDVPLDAGAPSDPGLVVYTSGTTGAPKGAVLTQANLLAGAHAVRLAWRWTPADRLLLTLPLFHVHGLGVGLHGTLTAGASAVLRPRFDAADISSAVEEHAPTLWFGVPTMYSRLATAGRLGDLAPLRLCVSGSAPLDPGLWHAAADAGQPVLERYGMSETLMLVSNPYDGERRPGTVGQPLPGVELRLAEGTDEVLVRGPNVMPGYFERPDATAQAFDADGWFATGDVGRDDDGYLRLVGRRKELIISGGFNVYPREVEDVLRTHPAVRDAAVAGVPDAEWGERVSAWVEADGVSERELVEHAASRLAPYKRPRTVVLVDALPRNALGKVVKAELRSQT